MRRFLVVLAAAMFSAAPSHAANSKTGDVEAGRRLYWEGVSADGQPVTALTEGDIEISGSQFSCVNCHRPSAYGSSEGSIYVPPIRGDFLYSERSGDRNRIFKELYQETQSKEFWAEMRNPRSRPAYTDATLKKVLIDGADPTGRMLNATMPRYRLSDGDIANLIAFLKTMTSEPDPGVTPNEIHFATIVTPGVDPAQRKLMLDVLEAHFGWMNRQTKGNIAHPGFSPNYRSEFAHSFRLWDLHVWELKGSPESWPDQLSDYYQKQPVFAVVSGLVNGPFKPIADFCDRTSTPCVFPITELPRTNDALYKYSIYFNGGRELEGKAVAQFLTADSGAAEVTQYFLDDDLGAAAASAFAKTAEARGANVDSQSFSTAEELKNAVAKCCRKKMQSLVVWPGAASADVVQSFSKNALKQVKMIYLPSDAIEPARKLDSKLERKLRFAYPYEKPGVLHPREFDVRAWMGSRRLEVTADPRIQFETYYALTMIQHSIEHMLDDFNREYLIELIEHEAEKNLNPGTYPTLALGPGQRFASKGAFIMRIDNESSAGIAPVSDWIVP